MSQSNCARLNRCLIHLFPRAGTLDYMAPEVLICPDKSLPHENKDLEGIAYGTLVGHNAILSIPQVPAVVSSKLLIMTGRFH